jgi:hypothetical protein
MESLPLSFRDRGFLYEQVEREASLALYRQTNHAGVVRYEVIRIRIQREHTWPNGTTTPEKEAYPGSNSWGALGFTCHTLAEAQALMASLHAMQQPHHDADDDTAEDDTL